MPTTQINKNELKDWIDSLEGETVSIGQVIEEIEEKALKKEVQRRVEAFESGDGKAIPGEEIEKKYNKRFNR
jgi:predicted HicB family RNase H-like nuclease